tara:strand:- start:128 stop:520 length:393 start_codon:yes stop_codon:yes gene_type:complete
MKKMNKKDKYREYLASPEWKAKRQDTFYKQGKVCRVCGNKKGLQIHHRRYRHQGKSILGNELNANLLVICKRCHMLWHHFHGYKKIPFPTLRKNIKDGVPYFTAFKHPYLKYKTYKRNPDKYQARRRIHG